MKSILLHSCCGPCATYTVEWLREHDFEVTAFWYNPNIHPFTEHRNRLESMQKLADYVNMPFIVAEGYDMINYFRAVVGHEGNRCIDCYRMRLNKTAQVARENAFDAFTTTLLISPYQDHALIDQAGSEAAQENKVDFFFHDFSEGFRQSHQMYPELDLYHQKYCGCVYSEWERYAKMKIRGDKDQWFTEKLSKRKKTKSHT